MFAIALWDCRRRELTLARDRLGKKPLYYGRHNDTWLWASELKALHAHRSFRPELDRDALAAYFKYSYVPSPLSIYRGMRKLAPAHFVTLRDAGDATPQRYWNAEQIAVDG